ncbi:hypothetical protein L1887_21365 [Cichorium endivia]|nr:hypothetical protein L1887_21365 [Cichorium endivia]
MNTVEYRRFGRIVVYTSQGSFCEGLKARFEEHQEKTRTFSGSRMLQSDSSFRFSTSEGIDYMADEVDILDFVMDDEDANVDRGRFADDYDMVIDTSSTQARRGKEIQGIPWEILNITTESYTQTKLEQYRNYENILLSGDAVDKKCKQKQKGGNYYEFSHNIILVNPTIFHFQVTNLVWANSKHDVYLMSNNSIMHWSSLSFNLTEILNFSAHVAPTEGSERRQDFIISFWFWTKSFTRSIGAAAGYQHTSKTPKILCRLTVYSNQR